MPGRFAFLPNVRTRLAADAVHHGGPRLSLSYDLEIRGDAAAQPPRIPVSAQLRGPGDVIAIDKAQIVRVEPEPGLRAFEPNYFPFVEFMDPDFPWRYSLDAGEGSRKDPWLVLVALKPDEFEFTNQDRAPLPSIRILNPAQSLPDLAQAWAFSHVQVSLADAGNQDAGEALQEDPARGFARVLCPRKLEERQSYFLFLVPAYQAGADAGLGKSNSADPFDQRAWSSANTAALVLPFYHQSRFNTDTQEDLERLLRRLRPLNPAEVNQAGAAPVASSAKPGYYPGYSKPGADFEIQTALRSPASSPKPFETDVPLADLMKTTLNEAIQGEGLDAGANDPLIAFPAYGFRFRQETEVSTTRARQNRWFDRINLDLKMRQAAAMGAQTVQENQEFFSKLCWDQYEEIAEANRRLARLRAAEQLVRRISEKHYARLDPDVAVCLGEPVQPFVLDNQGRPLADTLRRNGIPSSFASRGLRRLAAKRPVLRRLPGHGPRQGIPAPSIPGDRTPARPEFDGVNTRTDRRKDGMLNQKGVSGDIGEDIQKLLGIDAFNRQNRPRGLAVEVQGFRSRDFADAILETLVALPLSKARLAVGGLRPEESETIAPIFRSPEVPLALSGYLAQISPTTILGSIGDLPENTVSIFEENRLFIESFMVGANHAMNDELRWREFPTDMRGTIFRRFWNRGRRYDDPRGDDISEIHTWVGRLGRNIGPADQDGAPNLAIVIKGDVVRKLGQPIVVINEAAGNVWRSGRGESYEPIFFGKIGRDAAYFGFDVSLDHLLSDSVRDKAFLVIYEPMGRLRFGLDVGSAAIRAERRVHGSLSLSFPIKDLGRSYDQVGKKLPNTGLPAPATPGDWDELSWEHMQLTPAGYVNFDRTLSIPGKPNLWGTSRTSASLARSFWQKPLAAVLPLKRVL